MTIKKKRPFIPPLCGVKEVADILNMKRTTIPSMRKIKDFPSPVQTLACGPLWLMSEVLEYKEMKENKKGMVESDVHGNLN